MPTYIDLGLTADADQLRQDGLDWIEAQAPAGYSPDPFIDWLLGAVARMAAEIVVIAGQLPALELFRQFGILVLRINDIPATHATGTVEFTLADTLGHTVEAGAQIDIDGVGFQTTAPLVIAAAASIGQVPVQAIYGGADASGLTGLSVTLISPSYVWVSTVTLIGVTTGGVDGETDQEYVDRLADETPALSPKAILVRDFEIIARADIEVVRALAIDNYVPPTPGPEAFGVAGAITVAVQAAGGADVSGPGITRVGTTLETGRVLALAVYVINPTRNTIDVAFTATAHDDFNPAAVQADATVAIQTFLSAAGWGIPPGGTSGEWIDEPTVTHNDLIGLLYRVDGIRHVAAVTLGIVKPVTISAATDFVTLTGHGYLDTDPVVFTGLVGGAGLTNGTTYYVRDRTANTFHVAATVGGAVINVTTDATAGNVRRLATSDVTMVGPAAVPAAGAITATVT